MADAPDANSSLTYDQSLLTMVNGRAKKPQQPDANARDTKVQVLQEEIDEQVARIREIKEFLQQIETLLGYHGQLRNKLWALRSEWQSHQQCKKRLQADSRRRKAERESLLAELHTLRANCKPTGPLDPAAVEARIVELRFKLKHENLAPSEKERLREEKLRLVRVERPVAAKFAALQERIADNNAAPNELARRMEEVDALMTSIHKQVADLKATLDKAHAKEGKVRAAVASLHKEKKECYDTIQSLKAEQQMICAAFNGRWQQWVQEDRAYQTWRCMDRKNRRQARRKQQEERLGAMSADMASDCVTGKSTGAAIDFRREERKKEKEERMTAGHTDVAPKSADAVTKRGQGKRVAPKSTDVAGKSETGKRVVATAMDADVAADRVAGRSTGAAASFRQEERRKQREKRTAADCANVAAKSVTGKRVVATAMDIDMAADGEAGRSTGAATNFRQEDRRKQREKRTAADRANVAAKSADVAGENVTGKRVAAKSVTGERVAAKSVTGKRVAAIDADMAAKSVTGKRVAATVMDADVAADRVAGRSTGAAASFRQEERRKQREERTAADSADVAAKSADVAAKSVTGKRMAATALGTEMAADRAAVAGKGAGKAIKRVKAKRLASTDADMDDTPIKVDVQMYVCDRVGSMMLKKGLVPKAGWDEVPMQRRDKKQRRR